MIICGQVFEAVSTFCAEKFRAVVYMPVAIFIKGKETCTFLQIRNFILFSVAVNVKEEGLIAY